MEIPLFDSDSLNEIERRFERQLNTP